MENFLQFRERKESMVNIHEIEGIVEVLYRGIGVRRVGNRMVRGPMLSLNGCHCRDYRDDGAQGEEGQENAKGNDSCMAAILKMERHTRSTKKIAISIIL